MASIVRFRHDQARHQSYQGCYKQGAEVQLKHVHHAYNLCTFHPVKRQRLITGLPDYQAPASVRVALT